jgi:type VI protein secretion system component VasK
MDRQITAGVLIAVFLQTGGVLIWAGREATRIEVIEQRLDRQSNIAERLTRLEEQVFAARATLERMEHKLDRGEASAWAN